MSNSDPVWQSSKAVYPYPTTKYDPENPDTEDVYAGKLILYLTISKFMKI